MHIKQISIKGFKSYREEVRVTELPEGHVCVIGLNGSGKSNFFKAIQFVLCDEKFDRLSKQERISLLHEVSYEINDTVHFDFKNKEIGTHIRILHEISSLQATHPVAPPFTGWMPD